MTFGDHFDHKICTMICQFNSEILFKSVCKLVHICSMPADKFGMILSD